jgi:hypothetical protein
MLCTAVRGLPFNATYSAFRMESINNTITGNLLQVITLLLYEIYSYILLLHILMVYTSN